MAREYKQFPLPRLRELRLERKLSTRKLAEMAHVSRATVVEVEAGRRSNPKTRNALAEALDVHPWRLIFPDEQVNAAFEDGSQENQIIKEWLAAMTEEEIRELLESEPGQKIRAAIEHADKDRRRLEAERQQDAG